MEGICERIEALLRERGISGSRMSADLGMSRSFMTELRKGRAKSVSAENAARIAEYLGVSTDYLLCVAKTQTLDLTGLDEEDIAVLYALATHLRRKNREMKL